jgi:hypothetical protein
MIIAFYLGAGGNRYLQKLLGNDWAQPHRSYDLNNTGQQYEHRYLLENIPPCNSQHILTHCMNSKRIHQVFPDQPVVFIKSNLQASLRREWILHGHQRFQDQKTKSTVSKLEHYKAIQDPSWPDITTEDQLCQLPANIAQEVHNDYIKVINPTVAVPNTLTQLTQNIIDQLNSSYEIITWHRAYYEKYPEDFFGAAQVINIDTDTTDFCLLMRNELSLYQSEIFDRVWSTINER